MIPETIRKEHILKAAEWIDKHGVGARQSKKYAVIIAGKLYPPKLIISKACLYATGSEWPHDNFTGGDETNSYLRGLGFEIVRNDSLSAAESDRARRRISRRSGRRTVIDPRGPCLSLSPLERVRGIAKSMNIRVTNVESDTDGQDTDSLLVLHMDKGNAKDIQIVSDSEGEDDVLYVLMHIEFDPPISGYVSETPSEEYSEFVKSLMRGRTRFELELDGTKLKSVDLRQTVAVPLGDDTLKRTLLAAVIEILETDTNVKKAVRDTQGLPDSSEGKKKKGSRDSMYA